MTKIFTASVLTAAAVLFLAAPADAASLAGRQRNQVHRTRQGIASGQINRNEARILAGQQQRIHRQVVRDRRDGRGLTAGERARANRALDRQSGRIYRARHNGR
jgi:hypothetical protein